MRIRSFPGVLLLGSVVCAATAAFGQNPPPAPTAAASAAPAAPQAPPAAAAADTSAPASAPAVVPRPMSEQPPVRRPVVQRHAAGKARAKTTINGPVATFPGFKVLPDGTSRVFVEVSRKVDITEHKAQGRVVYRMKGVSVPIRTNRLPLLTGFFASPVGRIQLVPEGDDMDLVVELRAPSEAQHKITESEGGIVLTVDFPKSADSAALGAPGRPQTAPARNDAARGKRPADTTTLQGGTSGY